MLLKTFRTFRWLFTGVLIVSPLLTIGATAVAQTSPLSASGSKGDIAKVLSAAEKEALIPLLASMTEWGKTFKEKNADLTLISDLQIAQALRQIARTCEVVASDIRRALLVTAHPELRQFYSSNLYSFVEMGEIYRVGAGLLEARATANMDILISLAAALVTKEAKQLALPILTRAELQLRIEKFKTDALPRDIETRRAINREFNNLIPRLISE